MQTLGVNGMGAIQIGMDESELFVKVSMILCFYRIDSMRLHD